MASGIASRESKGSATGIELTPSVGLALASRLGSWKNKKGRNLETRHLALSRMLRPVLLKLAYEIMKAVRL
jgi:hypothetical protein